MHGNPRSALFAGALAVLAGCVMAWSAPVRMDAAPAPRFVQAPAQAGPTCAVTWPQHREAVEACLRDCEIDRVEEVPIGVTKPKRIFFKPGQALQSMAWKPLRPGIYRGYRESYKSEIAAYELDRLLGMNMVPPVVERRVQGDLGAAVLWVDDVKGWKIGETVQAPDQLAWSRLVIRMKMFDQLIGNIDRNQGNLLYDADYHLVLIDHSRAFTSTKDISQEAQPSMIDGVFWDKIDALTLEQLDGALGQLLGKNEIKAILDRRDKMRVEIDKMVQKRGARAVFIR